MDRVWEKALQHLRDQGEDVDEILREGARNVSAWHALHDSDPERHARLMAEHLRREMDHDGGLS